MQQCQADAQEFSRMQRDVNARMAKKLPEALALVGEKLEEMEATIVEMAASAKENEVNGGTFLFVCERRRQSREGKDVVSSL